MKDGTFTADRLLALYDRVAEAEDAIPRLRRFVLDLAVRGKLVEQDPNDEPAAELLKRIAKEKARLVKAGEMRKEKPQRALTDAQAPFDYPSGWALTRLGSVIDLLSGQHLQPPEYSETVGAGVPYITGPSDFHRDGLSITRYALARKAVAKHGQLLLTVKGSGVGKTTICDLQEVAISRQLMALTPILWKIGFLEIITHRLAESLQSQARSLIPGIAREDVEDFVFPLPPLSEQQRIVAKVDELMALCDRLQAARVGREAVRDRLTTATLARLTAPEADAETFPTHARFALQTLPTLTTRPDQIKTLRQTILNLAVRGKLVEQDPTDEPAAELLKRIAVEKAHRRVTGEKRKEQELKRFDNLEAPFALPSGWLWVPMGELGETNVGLTYSPNDVAKVGTPVLRSSNIQNGKLDFEDLVRVRSQPKESAMVENGDLLICARNGSRALVGKVAIIENLPEPSAFGAFMAIFRSEVNRYLYTFISSPVFRSVIDEVNTTTINQITQNNLRSTLAPLPPLAEQHRIVAKVDALMALCDELETSLTTTTTTRSRLLEALLHEALGGHLGVAA